MKLFKGQSVKILFRNNASVEGIVDTWEVDNYVLKSLDGKSFLIIQNPNQDIVLIKVIINDTAKVTVTDHIKPINVEPENTEELNKDLRYKKLAELRIAKIEQEKKIIAEQLKSHTITNTAPIGKYIIPNIKRR
jgi:hypothetical protein